ncbi:MAG TPA: Gfo/Idh/MocA family oxidoreductase [Anaerolineaceae bacterium]|nr:Gfo/Idh/MocA family oxidoreductase [Anaerolineaceae bacterium]HQH86851.1 Gfo/Idh/MocA family oxidoreductase [Anaerolineaceae bacterium]
MRFLIAGFGSIGRRHLRNLLALGQTDLVLLRSGRSTLPTDEIAGLPVEHSLDAALAHRPEAVFVATPTALHMDVAIPAAAAGCHLFLEKPIDADTTRVPELRAALAHGGGQVLVGFQYRFHPGLRKVRSLLAQNAIGRVVSARAQWGEYLPGWHPWEDYRQGYAARADLGGGVVRTLCHPLDYLRWLMGEVTAVRALTDQLGGLEIEVEDTAEIALRFESGALGSVHLNYLQRPGVHRLEIIGAEGTIQWDNADGSVRIYRAAASQWEVFLAPEGFERNALFLDQTRHFIDVVQGRAAPRCTLDDGVRALELVQAVLESRG